MKVRCKYRCLDEIENKPSSKNFEGITNRDDVSYEFEVGNIYTVHGIIFWHDLPMYYIQNDERDENCPYAYPYLYFEMVDPRISRYWKMSISDEIEPFSTELVFPEWADDKLFYEKLLDDDPECIEIYKKYKELMDKEFE